ncbi:hypothetical protein U4E84_10690 [Halorubrum sp. AD140]|uniref:DUF7847 domain-containing protein n=1 Tax=Halorubrum sp. AD140 TaxID=3050073 RepID=UPI002ACC5329|nr:hypothetical protein [Halorubrum sp. AD140]MDZ5811807.1 hypothetical protein [Halorubrum sp. AD140]
MAALHALRPAVGGIVRNPILLLVTALFGLSQVPSLLVPPTRPILSALISLGTFGVLVLALPFFQGGVLGMASEAIAGRTGLGTLVAAGKEHYLSLLLGYFVLLAINLAFGFVSFVGGVVVVAGGLATAGSADAPGIGVSPTLLVLLALVGGGLLLAYFLVSFAVQFYAHAVVLDDAELVAGFRRSVRLVRSNPVSVLGYSLVLLAGSVSFGTLAAVASLVLGAFSRTAGMGDPSGTGGPSEMGGTPFADLVAIEPSPLVVAVAALGYLLLTAAFGAFYATYSVAFYEAISRDEAGEPARRPRGEAATDRI